MVDGLDVGYRLPAYMRCAVCKWMVWALETGGHKCRLVSGLNVDDEWQ